MDVVDARRKLVGRELDLGLRSEVEHDADPELLEPGPVVLAHPVEAIASEHPAPSAVPTVHDRIAAEIPEVVGSVHHHLAIGGHRETVVGVEEVDVLATLGAPEGERARTVRTAHVDSGVVGIVGDEHRHVLGPTPPRHEEFLADRYDVHVGNRIRHGGESTGVTHPHPPDAARRRPPKEPTPCDDFGFSGRQRALSAR